MSIDDHELCDRYERLYPGAVTDTLDEFGFDSRVLPPDITPLTDDTTVAGIAFPVRGRRDLSVDYERNIRRILEMLGDVPADSVLITQANDEKAAHMGELMTTALAANDCRGAVIDGGIRDVRFILDQEFPAFCRYRTPADAPPRWRCEEWDVPVRVGDVEVRPGDVLVGDVDGVVCVPKNVADDVLERAEAIVDAESEVREAVRDGVDPLEAYDTHGKF